MRAFARRNAKNHRDEPETPGRGAASVTADHFPGFFSFFFVALQFASSRTCCTVHFVWYRRQAKTSCFCPPLENRASRRSAWSQFFPPSRQSPLLRRDDPGELAVERFLLGVHPLRAPERVDLCEASGLAP